MRQGSGKRSTWLAYAFIIAGVVARLLPHPPNVTPVTGMALFGGWALTPRWLALVVPLAVMALSDAFIGWHQVVVFTWGSFVAVGVLGLWLRRGWNTRRLAVASLASSTLFFLVTNFGVWWTGAEGLYPRTAAGLATCYVAALPFYRNALLGDLAYTVTLFGCYQFCCAQWFRESAQPAPARAA